MGEELDRLHNELQQYGERWRATVPPAQVPRDDLGLLRDDGRRFLVPAAAAAAVLAAVVGIALGTGGSNDRPSLNEAKPTVSTTPTPTTTTTPVAPGDVVPWEPLDPTGAHLAEGGIDGSLELTTDPGPDEELLFRVTLTAREGDVSLAQCPDYSIIANWSWDDVVEARYALNCAAVPYRDSAGAPYLPDGVAVTFDMVGYGLSGGPERTTWKLKAPGGPSLPIPITEDGCDPVPPRQLPSGAGPGEARPLASDYGEALAWGKGEDRVVQLAGANPLGLEESRTNQVAFRSTRAHVTAIGDPGQIAFVFRLNDCIYTNWIGPDISMTDAEAYISTF
jgi:hypothetical protein